MQAGTHFDVRGDGPALLLISGLGGLGGFWKHQIEALSRRFTVITYDQHGLGRSAARPGACSIETLAQQALALMDSLGAARFSIVGHSTGGAIAQHIAAHEAVRVDKLVLCATWLRADPYFRSLFELRRDIAAAGRLDWFQRLGSFLLYPPSWIAEHRGELDAPEARRPDADVLLARIDALLAHDGSEFVKAIACPTLVLCARDDAVAPPHLAEALAHAIADVALVRFDWGGHYMQHTITREYNEALLAFL